jgi:hypothetical protein
MIEEEIAQGLAEDRIKLEPTGILHKPADQILQLAHYALRAKQSIN